jgi:hypothetical protein
VAADESVCEDEKLSHYCHDGDLSGFSDFDHGPVFGFEFRVASDDVEGRHVEGLSGSWAAAADGPLAMGLAAVTLARGARPTRLAAWALSRHPSSGVSTTRTFAVASPRHGMLVKMSKR